MGLWDSIFGGGGGDVQYVNVSTAGREQGYYDALRAYYPDEYEQTKQYDPRYQAEQRAALDAQRASEIQAATAAAQGSGMGSSPTIDPAAAEASMRQDALARLNAALPGGFEQGLLPGTFDDPFIEDTFGQQRGRATESLETMARRGTVTPTGKAAGLRAITAQEPGVRTQLSDIGNLLLEQERAGLRGIRGTGEQAASTLTAGQTFDPATYSNQINQRVGDFTSGFGGQFAGALPAGDLFDVSGLASVSGAVQGPRNISYDPYAVEGGKLSTGLGEAAPVTPGKKRTTEVF